MKLMQASAALALCLAVLPLQAEPLLPLNELFQRPLGPRGLSYAPQAQALDGQRVELRGYMVQREAPLPGRFLLTPVPVRLSEHDDGPADDLPAATVTVLLDPSQQQRLLVHQAGPLRLRGVLRLGRDEGPDGRVSWARLQLDADALSPEPLAAAAPTHSH